MLENIIFSNFILACDSYKVSHAPMYPRDTEYLYVSVVPRKVSKFSNFIVAMGQTYASMYLSRVRITKLMIDEAEIEITEQGYEFDRTPWEFIADKLDGVLPLAMYGVEEGRVVKPQTPIAAFINTHKDFAWLPGYIETLVQRIIWKMSTVATISRTAYKDFEARMLKDGSDMTMLEYKLHNFGDRGADGFEPSLLAAVAHAALFSGSDCLQANRFIKQVYNTKKPYLSSVEASEHSVMCSWSDAEKKDDWGAALAMVNRLDQVVIRAQKGIGIPLMSAVIDTYDDERFVKEYIGQRLKRDIEQSGGKLVLRPDSGDPLTKPVEVIGWAEECFGSSVNGAGYKVLAPCIGVIQGDGINVFSVPQILDNIQAAGYSLDNIVLGMGGGLTHDGGRDTFSFSMKATARFNGKEWINLLKEPKTDAGKKSLTGLVSVSEGEEGLVVETDPTVAFETGPGWRQWLKDGERPWVQDFDSVRAYARA